jgi:hypothetical protein
MEMISKNPRFQSDCYFINSSNIVTVHFSFLLKRFIVFHCRFCVATLRILQFSANGDSLLGMFDGHDNDEIPNLVADNIAGILQYAMSRHNVAAKFMKYTMLVMHR